MKSVPRSRIRILSLLATVVLGVAVFSGCVYYNTFYNAKKAFNEAESQRKQSGIQRGRVNRTKYQTAIDKSEKVIEDHPNSKYYDDALYVVGISYYYLEQYSKSERRLREILANYPESEFATEAEVYLAKAKLMQNDVEEAMDQFRLIFQNDFKREYKAEAAMALGDYYFERQLYDEARPYYRSIRDSIGRGHEKVIAQRALADASFEEFQFRDALTGYLQILGMDPEKEDEYHALYRSAVCSYRLQRIDDGLDYLQTLISDDRFFDSLGVLRLQVAQGYEYDADLLPAVATYESVLDQEDRREVAAEAAYRLGLIYQFDYDDLAEAKRYYDTTAKLDRGSDVGQEALQRSADIGKLETFARTIEIDSSTTQSAIDDAAVTQYKLAELYWFQLNKPDTAIMEMQYIVDSFPSAYDAPKAMIALSQMVAEYEEDSAKGDSILRHVLVKYPQSDYIEEAMVILGLKGTAADSGYAGVMIERAEHFVVDTLNLDSARYYYQRVVDDFPDSKYNLQARFALIFLEETYNSPGDSSVYYAYTELIDSFPGTFWASEARNRIQEQGSRRRRGDDAGEEREDTPGIDSLTGLPDSVPADSLEYVDQYTAIYIGPDGEDIPQLPSDIKPVQTLEEFEYPSEAFQSRWEGDLYFQIKLDFAGEVIDHIQKTYAPVDEININASRAIGSMTFNITDLDERLQDSWLVYKLEIRLPDHLR